MAQTAEQAGQSQYFSPAAFLCSACTRNAFAPSSPIYSAASGVPRNAIRSSIGSISSSSSLRYFAVSSFSVSVPTDLSQFSAASFASLHTEPEFISSLVFCVKNSIVCVFIFFCSFVYLKNDYKTSYLAIIFISPDSLSEKPFRSASLKFPPENFFTSAFKSSRAFSSFSSGDFCSILRIKDNISE